MLEGIKVVEFATAIAAPGAGGILADWGADVVKVEVGLGDPTRGGFANLMPDGVGAGYHLDNRGKRSVHINIRTEEGRSALLRLLRQADVFITNRRPAALKAARLDWDSIKAENPRLIYSSVTGYGLQGPDSDLPAYDVAAFWSRGGVASLLIPKGEDPFVLRTGIGDHACSLATVGGILAALLRRTSTGEGALVETSLLRSGVYAVGSDMATFLRLGRIKSNRPRKESLAPLVNFFRTRDGQWVCVMPRDGRVDWPNICKVAGRPELAEDPRFRSDRRRRENVRELVEIFDEAFAALDYSDVAAQLRALDVVFSPVQTAAQVAADPQAEAAGCFVELTDRNGGVFRSPAAPVRFPGADRPPRGPAPERGQHTAEVLEDAGLTTLEIEQVIQATARAQPGPEELVDSDV
jgi:crotonobetainyl-CoA:carnitine CoA-transferase CaiB-like acyl-CoA transferase